MHTLERLNRTSLGCLVNTGQVMYLSRQPRALFFCAQIDTDWYLNRQSITHFRTSPEI